MAGHKGFHIGQAVNCRNKYTDESFRGTVTTVLKREKSLIVQRGSNEFYHVRPKTFSCTPITK